MNALPRALRRSRWGIAGVVGGSGLAIGGSLVAALAAASALFVALGGGGSTAAMALGPGNSCIASPVPVDTSQATPTGSNAPAEMFSFPSPQPPYGQYEGQPQERYPPTICAYTNRQANLAEFPGSCWPAWDGRS